MRCQNRFKQLERPHTYSRNAGLNLQVDTELPNCSISMVMDPSIAIEGIQFTFSWTGIISISTDFYKLISLRVIRDPG